MLSPAGLEEASHGELYGCKEMNSACKYMSLEEDPEPQMRPQSVIDTEGFKGPWR